MTSTTHDARAQPVAMAVKEVFRTALAGRCHARPELAASAILLEIRVPALACRGGGELARRLFERLGWSVVAVVQPLDPQIPE
jgi:hypothetical protein